jgi:DNA-binding response OmpR family regulator
MPRTRILVVNDEPALREFFRFNLQARGYDVIQSVGCPEVADIIKKERPDIAIIDLMLSGANGFDLCKSICDAGESAIIVFNMRGGEADLLKCVEMGVDDYLGKPLGVDELMSRVRAVERCKQKSTSSGTTDKKQNLVELGEK